MKTERELFEEWAESNSYYLDKNADGSYKKGSTAMAWEIWQASATREGFKLVPVEPTLKMSVAYEKNSIAPVSSLSVAGYKAMIGVLE